MSQDDDMSRASFALKYEGPALQSGVMSVRELAPALLAFGNLIDQVNGELNGDRAKVDVKLKALSPGSILVTVIVDVAFLNLVLGGPVKTAKEILEVVSNVVDIVKKLRGERIEAVVTLKNGQTQLITEHKHIHDVSDRVYNLMRKRAVQSDMQGILHPLREDGVDRLFFLESGEVVERVDSEDVEYFDALPGVLPDVDEKIVETTSVIEKYYVVVTLSSKAKVAWKLTDRGSDVSVFVTNKDILQRASAGLLGIEPGFIIKVRIKSVTIFDIGEPKTRNTLEAILDVKRPAKPDQSNLLS